MNRYTTTARPANIPANWIVMNATRPLLGSIHWRDGSFYAAITPDDDAARVITKNTELDAYTVHYITENAALLCYLSSMPEHIANRYHDRMRASSIQTALRRLNAGTLTFAQ